MRFKLFITFLFILALLILPYHADAKTEPLKILNKIVKKGYEKPTAERYIDTIIVHSTYNALGGNVHSLKKILKEYRIYGVAAHYIITRKGTIYRIVPETFIAWHAGAGELPDGRKNMDINDGSIGIEMIYTENETPSTAQYKSLNKLIDNIKSRYTIKYVLGHNQIAPDRKTDPWNFDWGKIN